MASSSTATIVGLRKPSKATAFLVLSTTGPYSFFAADTDGAEKGISGPAYKLNNMKRLTTSKNGAPPLETKDFDTSQEAEQALSSGASRYPGLQRLVDNTSELGEVPRGVVPSTTDSPTTNSAIATPDSERTSVKEGPDEDDTSTIRVSLLSSLLLRVFRILPLLHSGPSIVTDTGHERILTENYIDFPRGFPQLAAFFNSSDNLAIARRFGRAHLRVLLHLACEITTIEKELDELDKRDSTASTRYRLRRNDYNDRWDPAQKQLMDKLKLKLVEYDDILLKDAGLRALAPAPVRDHLSAFNWIYGEKPLDKDHYDFIYHQDDFVSLSNKPEEGFSDFIKSYLNRSHDSWIQRLFRYDNDEQQGRDQHVYLFSPQKISIAAQIIAISIVVTILLVPIFLLLLTELSRKATSVMVLLFTLAFAAMISFTGAKIESVFVGTCTYCAVLVTFLGNLQVATPTQGSV